MGRPLDVVFLWHMHQPDYRDHGCGEYALPWVYLHGLKDYSDMAAHLERHPGIRAVVNFVPVLLEQIEDYSAQFRTGQFRDPLLRLLARPSLASLENADRKLLFSSCFRSNHTTMLAPFPGYRRLHELYQLLHKEGEAALDYLSEQYFSDLLTWYHLAWTGETERRARPLLAELMAKGEGYSAADRQRLLDLIGEILTGLIPRYRALMARGQIELSATPQTHPLAPLLLDFQAARESLPSAALPNSAAYPGGRTRVLSHISAARQSHAHRFGAEPNGMWPAEGAISTPFLSLLAASGCRWVASGQGVLNNSLGAGTAPDPRAPYHPWHLPEAPGLTLFFRDERLSDLIGFEYAKWHGRDAASHLVAQLEAIAEAAPDGERPLVSLILDGENAWEHYPYNAYFFFEDLYGLLENHPSLQTTTYSEILSRAEPPPAHLLPGIKAGSWVFGTLSTWIGDPEKNRAWDLLCAAKRSFDLVAAGERLSPEALAAAEHQLAICESSDWFWWFGDYNPQEAVASFDRLFRDNLRRLYSLLQLAPPVQLDSPISRGSAAPHTTSNGGTMRRAT